MKLGNFYFHGRGVEQNFVKAKDYYLLSLQQNKSKALLKLGKIYEFGFGVKRDFVKAKEYYSSLAKQNDPKALLKLGTIYESGFANGKDILRAIECYKKAGEQNNSDAYLKLGDLYYKGNEINKNLTNAIKYYELSANLNNSKAHYLLGLMYLKGDITNNSKMIEHFDIAAKLGNSDALFQLGKIYEENIFKANGYYVLSAKKENLNALYYLGLQYFNGDVYDYDLNQSIYYFDLCIEIHDEKEKFKQNSKSDKVIYYRANNDLGYINFIKYYKNEIENLDTAIKYLKVPGLNEYPFGQNNLGVHYYYNNKNLKEKRSAIHLFKRASMKKFSLAEYNLAYMFEKDGMHAEAIKYYILASKHENEQQTFHEQIIVDKRLEVSKEFIICLTNLILMNHYLSLPTSNENIDEAKKYFNEVLLKLAEHKTNSQIPFHIINEENEEKNIYSMLVDILVCFTNKSSFNNSKLEEKQIIEFIDTYYSSLKEFLTYKKQTPYMKLQIPDHTNSAPKKNDLNNNDLIIIFDSIVKNQKNINIFIQKIEKLIDSISSYVHSSPYDILFGRIDIKKSNKNLKQPKDINNNFYDGFGIDV